MYLDQRGFAGCSGVGKDQCKLGHLYGTALPVGGAGTHSVLTAHSGLAEHRMFTDLPDLESGDIFTIETYGEQLHYKVTDMQEVLPHETETLVPEVGRDLVTLVTCTPVGVNSHRMLVTAERTEAPEPAPQYPMESKIPGFPWWAVILGAALLGITLYLWRSNRRVSVENSEGAIEVVNA